MSRKYLMNIFSSILKLNESIRVCQSLQSTWINSDTNAPSTIIVLSFKQTLRLVTKQKQNIYMTVSGQFPLRKIAPNPNPNLLCIYFVSVFCRLQY